MIDHISLGVSDIERAKAFYDAALAPLGFPRVMDFAHAAGYGAGRPQFWISVPHKRPAAPGSGTHIAFTASDRGAVDAFYQAALAAGGSDNGAPGLRGHYHPDYYAAFVIDPDGNRVEAVCHHSI
ncbi:MAG TPA: VOC family protein [Azospirillaceae bacterium]|nr:VOC family protein [Azospirillaceae bacterium]